MTLHLKKLNLRLKYNAGIFPNTNMENAAKIMVALLKKVDEQTEAINQLSEEIENLKKKP